MTILLLAETAGGALAPATAKALSAAKEIGGAVHILVAGSGLAKAAEQAGKLAGVEKVLYADNAAYDHALAESVAALIVSLAGGYDVILAPSTSATKNVLPRVAALLDVAQVSDIVKVVAPDTFERPIYAGNAIALVESSDPVKVITIRTTGFDPVAPDGGSASIEAVPVAPDAGISEFVSREVTKLGRPELTSASVIVSGGRGLGSGEHYRAVLEPLADRLGAAMGASRAAVDAGYAPNDYQVGQTGKIVAPQLYIAVGISGAIQHLAGMKDSKVIVAINRDEEAPIFSVADYGLVGDLFDCVPSLVLELATRQ